MKNNAAVWFHNTTAKHAAVKYHSTTVYVSATTNQNTHAKKDAEWYLSTITSILANSNKLAAHQLLLHSHAAQLQLHNHAAHLKATTVNRHTLSS